MLRIIVKTLAEVNPAKFVSRARFSSSVEGEGSEDYEAYSNAPNFEKSINNVTLLGMDKWIWLSIDQV